MSEYMTPGELSQMMNIPKRTIEKWIAGRRLPGLVKTGHQWRINRAEVMLGIGRGRLLIDPKPVAKDRRVK